MRSWFSPHALRRFSRVIVWPLVVCVVSCLLLWVTARSRQDLLLSRARQEVRLTALEVSFHLDLELEEYLSISERITDWVLSEQLEMDAIEQDFTEYVAQFFNDDFDLINVSLAPDGVQRWVYPAQQSTQVIGHDLLADERSEVRRAASTAMETGAIVMNVPYTLRQGGFGLVIRRGLLNTDDTPWGLVNVVVDMSAVIAELDAAIPSDVQVAVRAGATSTFYGDPTLFRLDSELVTVPTIGTSSWLVATYPVDGWHAWIAADLTTYVLTGLGLVALVTALTGWLSFQHNRLRQRTAVAVEANRALRESESRFRNLINASHDAIIGLDEDQKIVIFNRAAEMMFGYSANEACRQSIDVLLPGIALPADGNVAAPQPGSSRSGGVLETLGRRSDGSMFAVELALSLEADEDNHIQVLGVRDITVRKQQQKAVWLSEARYRSLTEDVLDNSAVGICILDAQLTVVWASQMYAKFFGVDRDALQGQDMRLLVETQLQSYLENSEAVVWRLMASYETNTTTDRFECHVLPAANREDRWLEHHSQPILSGLYAGGRIEHYYDITARKHAELISELSQAELQSRTESLETINKVSDSVHQSLHFPVIVESTLHLVQDYIKSRSVGLFYLIDDDTLTLEFMTSLNDAADEILHEIPLHDSVAGRVLEKRTVFGVEDIREAPGLCGPSWDFWQERGIKSAVTVPIIAQERPLGVMTLLFYESRRLTNYEQATLASIGMTIGLALSNADYITRIEKEAQRRVEAQRAEREQRVMLEALRDNAIALGGTLEFDEIQDRIIQHLTKVMPPHEVVRVLLLDDDGRTVAARSYFTQRREFSDEGKDIILNFKSIPNLNYMVEKRLPMAIPDVSQNPNWVLLVGSEWIRSTVGAPICFGNETYGFITVDAAQPNVFNQSHAERLMAFANQAGMMMRNARLFESERRQHNASEMLRDVALTMTSPHEHEDLLLSMLEQAARVIPYEVAGIWITDEAGQSQLMAHVRFDYFGRAVDFKRLDDALARLVDRELSIENRVFNRSDMHDVDGWQPGDAFAWIRALIAAPIVMQGVLKGRIVFADPEPDIYGSHHASVLATLSNQASVAIESAQLFRATQQYLQNSVALRQFGLELAASQQDLGGLIGLIEEWSTQILKGSMHEVWLWERGAVERVASIRDDDLNTPALQDVLAQMGKALSERAIATGETMVLTDLLEWRSLLPPMVDFPLSQVVVTPLVWQGQPLGSHIIAVASPESYSEDDIRLCQLFTSHVVPAIVNARLYTAVESHARTLEDEVQARTREHEQERAQLQTVLDALGEGVIYIQDYRLEFINPAMTTITGYTRDDLSGRDELVAALPIFDDTRRGEAYRLQYERTLAVGGVWRDEIVIRTRSGQMLDVSVSLAMVDRERRGIVAVVRDVSQEKALQAQKDRFIAYASHELRTPLTNMNTRLYLLRKQPQKLAEHLQVMEYVVARMRRLVEDLLELSRLQQGSFPLERQVVLLQLLLENIAKVQQADAAAKGLDLVLDLEHEPLNGNIDPARIEQVITNLVANAMNYTEEGGTITLRLRRTADPAVGVIEIEDSGIGIAPEMIEHVFEPFFRVEEQRVSGAGLGLTIAHEIMKLHGGEIEVESKPEVGTLFRLKVELI